MIFISFGDTFLSNIVVDQATIDKINETSRLLGKRQFYIQHYKSAFLEHLKNEYNAIHDRFPNVEIIPEARIKSQRSYKNKIEHVVDGTASDIFDIFGNRYIIVSVDGSKQEEDIIPVLYQIRDYLAYSSTEAMVIPERIKDYVRSPKHTTYQSLHITRLHNYPNQPRFQIETQLRSYFMHDNARTGLASHANCYKERIPGITPLPNSIEYILDENGYCIEIREKPIEKVFEDFFGIPYDPSVYPQYEEEK